MTSTFTYPGVYVEEIESAIHPIVPVSTSDTGFIDFFPRGPVGVATVVHSLAEFDRVFGGLDPRSAASYAVYHYFLNGGSTAWILRLTVDKATNKAVTATKQFKGGAVTDALTVVAANAGAWGNSVQVAIDHSGLASTFNIVAREVSPTTGAVLRFEVFRNLVMDAASPQFVNTVVNSGSSLIQVTAKGATIPDLTKAAVTNVTTADVIGATDIGPFVALGTGADGLDPPTDLTSFAAAMTQAALEPVGKVAPFHINLLCIPVAATFSAADWKTVSDAAAAVCAKYRIFYVADVPVGTNTAAQALGLTTLNNINAALYFPRLWMPDPLAGNLPKDVGASGAVAGIYARIDLARGVWKAPAGTEAGVRGATLQTQLDDAADGDLNVAGINVLRTFPVTGTLVWGSRTTAGADAATSEWKYVPVRRTAMYIEESLAQGLRWAVFEPNDEPLWRQISTNVFAFMNDLFREGAFAGATPDAAFLVKCDADTTLPSDVDRGIVNIIVGFQPLKPAEFVVLKIQQLAGQAA